MIACLEIVLLADAAHDFVQGGVLELDHAAALLAIHVLVLRVAVVVFVEHARPQLQPPQQAGINQLGKRAVDGGPADLEACPLHVVDQLLGIKVIVLGKDEPHHVALLPRKALRPGPAGQVFAKFVLGRLRHCDRRQGGHAAG